MTKFAGITDSRIGPPEGTLSFRLTQGMKHGHHLSCARENLLYQVFSFLDLTLVRQVRPHVLDAQLPLQQHRFKVRLSTSMRFFSNKYSGPLVATDFVSEGFTSKDSTNLRPTQHFRIPNGGYPATVSQLWTPASTENAVLHARLNTQV